MDIKSSLKDCKTFLLDCDGVLWMNNRIINRSNVAVKALQKQGHSVYFVSNTVFHTSQDILQKLQRFDVKAQIHLKSINFIKSVYVIGPDSIRRELISFGIRAYTHDEITKLESKATKKAPEIGAIVVGLDYGSISKKINRAIEYLKNEDVLYFSTDVEYFGYHTDGPIGLGETLEHVRIKCQRTPELFGKPSSKVFESLSKKFDIDPSTTCMVGDNICTDIVFGKRHNLKTVLVMSGDTNKRDLANYMKYYDDKHEFYLQYHAKPDHVCDDLFGLVQTMHDTAL
ncbi:Pyridoxal phosphate phosphatase [Thelohanellus kitauei]|uniref:Pyridoxal phosphate phosphatase n=1 Tax=Thelohanellus kitauei TaxID=669202 RepID=A0A0C2J0J3_THEKT|nr:Pyridoxal phosphate phosphatase [Thelohanellus kitauei]